MSTVQYLAWAIILVGWASPIWAPLIIVLTVRRPRYRWTAAIGVLVTMLAVFGGSFAALRPSPNCEGLEEFDRTLCVEGNAIGAVFLGYTAIAMAIAALLAFLFFLLGVSRKHEIRKVAH